MGPCGLVCVTAWLQACQLLELLRAGAAFAADWCELRSVTRNRLAGRVVPPDLAAAVESVSAAAAAAGAHGVGAVRYIRGVEEGDPRLPPGAHVAQVGIPPHTQCCLPQLPSYVCAHIPCFACVTLFPLLFLPTFSPAYSLAFNMDSSSTFTISTPKYTSAAVLCAVVCAVLPPGHGTLPACTCPISDVPAGLQ